jgi:hypothetical protein
VEADSGEPQRHFNINTPDTTRRLDASTIFFYQ